MSRRHSLDAVLFDVDGTLIDSNGAHAESWMRSLREHGVNVELAAVRHLIGMGADKVLPALASVTDDTNRGKVIARRKKELFDALRPTLQPTRGARALVQTLCDRHVRLVIATSASDDEMQALLLQAGVDDLFHARASKDDAADSKPDPDIVRVALKKAQTRPERTLMVGDTPYDIEAARRAGVGCVVLRCGGYWPDHAFRGAVKIFDDPEALLSALPSL